MLDGLGAIARRDLRAFGRSARTYQQRVTVAVVLVLALASGLPMLLRSISEDWVVPHWVARDAALAGFGGIVLTAALLFLGLVPPMVVADICGARERGTLALVLMTRLTSFTIVLGTFLTALIRVGVSLLVAAPLLVVLHRFGGVDLRILALAALCILVIAAFLTALVLVVAVEIRTSKPARSLAVVIALAWVELPFLLAIFLPRFVGGLYAVVRPLVWFTLASGPLAGPAYGLGLLPGTSLLDVILRMLVMQVVGTVALVALAVFRLRPAARALAGDPGSLPKPHEAGPRHVRPECGDDPVAWKERYTGRVGPLGRWLTRACYLFVFVGLFAMASAASMPSRIERAERGYAHCGAGDERWSFNQNMLRPFTGIGALILMVLVAGFTAESLDQERKSEAWTVLLSTPLDCAEILGAKRGEILRRWLPASGAPAILWGVGLASGAVHPLGLALSAAALIATLRLASSLGGYSAIWGARAGTTGVSRPFLVFLLAGFLAPVACVYFQGVEWLGLAAISPPFLPLVSLFSFDEVHALLARGQFGGLRVARIDSGGSIVWPFGAALAGPLILWGFARYLDGLTERLWDEAVGRPSRPPRATEEALPSRPEPARPALAQSPDAF